MKKAQDIINKIKVNNAKINRLSKKITVELSTKDYLFLEEERRITQHFKKHFKTDNLEIQCMVEKPEIGEKEKNDLVERIIDFCPTLIPYKNEIKIDVSDDSISVTMPDVCEPLVSATGVLRHISEYTINCLGLDSGVTCKIKSKENTNEQYKKIKQRLDSKIKKENGKIDISRKPEYKVVQTNNYSRRRSKVETVKICDLDNEYSKVAFNCEIISSQQRKTKTGRILIKFEATDFTSSITCIHFTDEKKAGPMMKILKPDMSVKVEGKYSYSNYEQENIIMVNKIEPCESVRSISMDEADEKRIELHLHTKMSAKDGFIEPDKLFKRLSEWGHKAVAITDHGVVQAFPDAHYYSQKHGIKVIYGVEGYLIDDGEAIMYNPTDSGFPGSIVLVQGLENEKFEACLWENGQIGKTQIYENADYILKAFPERPMAYLCYNQEDLSIKTLSKGGTPIINLAVIRERFLVNKWIDYKEADDKKIDSLDKSIAIASDILNEIKLVFENKKFKSLNHMCVKSASTTAKKTMKQHHVVILAKNKKGLKNLYELVSYSHLEFFYRKPRIPKSILEAKRLNLIIGSACEAGELYRAAINKANAQELSKIASFYDYLEIQPVGNNSFMVREEILENEDEIRKINKEIDRLGEMKNIPVVATCDAHFLDPRDEIYRKIIMHGMKFKDVEFQAPLYMRTTAEMLDEFEYLGPKRAYSAVVKAPAAIAESTDDIIPIPRETYPPVLEGSEETLRKICEARLLELYGDKPDQQIRTRLDKELDSIINNGFAVLYVIAQKLVNKSMEEGYLVGSRGSVGSSFAAFLAGITEVNPLPAHYICPNCKNIEFANPAEYDCGLDMPDRDCSKCKNKYGKSGFDIPFETFLGFDGTKMPDIDQNFSGEYQAKAHRYVEKIFGKDHVFKAGTISTIADRTAYGFVKGYLDDNEIPHNKAEVNRLVKGCAGVKRTTGQHPGGMVVLPKGYSIHDFTPVQKPADDSSSDTVTTHFDFNSMHDTLLKLDILGHDDPTILKMLEDLTGKKAIEVDIRDPKIMSLFENTESLNLKEDISCELGVLGIPEFGTEFVRGMIKTAVPKTISELIKLSGLSHGEDVWSGNAEELIKNGVATLQEVISVRDDIMLYLMRHGIEAITAFNIMEKIRKKSGKLQIDDEKIMLDHGIPKWYVESCKKIEYMFPKAHAAAYVIMALRIAWYKIYYPKEYYTAYFTVRSDEFDALAVGNSLEECRNNMKELNNKKDATAREQNIVTILEIAEEMYARGITFKPVNIEKSDAIKFICEQDGIRIPFIGVPGLGVKAAKNIVDERAKKQFSSLDDLSSRGKVNKTVMDHLIQMGAVEGLPESSQRSFF